MSAFKWFIFKFIFRKEYVTMAELYATLIIKGVKTFSQVPKTLKEKVRNILIALDLEELCEE